MIYKNLMQSKSKFSIILYPSNSYFIEYKINECCTYKCSLCCAKAN